MMAEGGRRLQPQWSTHKNLFGVVAHLKHIANQNFKRTFKKNKNIKKSQVKRLFKQSR